MGAAMLRLAMFFSAIVVAFDAVSAAVAKSVSTSYDSFLVLALVIFFFIGVYAGRVMRSWSAVLPVAAAAAVGATFGWYVAALIGPGYVPGWTMRDLIALAIESTILSTVVGLGGVWIGLGVSGVRKGFF
jgi:hypothetical protein